MCLQRRLCRILKRLKIRKPKMVFIMYMEEINIIPGNDSLLRDVKDGELNIRQRSVRG